MPNYTDLTKEELIQILEKKDKELARKYGIFWDAEKIPEKVVVDCEDNLPVLERVKEKSIKTDDTKDNILIEGDNYHALTVLNYTHKEKIDVIYIDPPYNTGNKDFTYNDRYVDKEDSYRHSKWLNFMEKRLTLAKGLLTDKGVIFISIDDNEQAQLKLLCDQVFGEQNFIACLPTVMNLKGNNDQFGFAGTHEYTFVYCKDIVKVKIGNFEVDEEEQNSGWETDEYGFYKKGANLKATGVNAPKEKRPNLFYPIFFKSDGSFYTTENNEPLAQEHKIIWPITENKKMSWRWSKQKLNNEKYNVIISTNGEINLYKKQRPELGDLPSKKPKTLFYKPEYSSGNGTATLKNIFGEKEFNNPKPITLIKDLLTLSTDKNSTILDFMAGSGTTGQAVLELNREDGGSRQFILCTNNELNGVGSKLADEKRPENTGDGGFENWVQQFGICQRVTYPRLEKVISGYHKNGDGDFVDGLGGNLQYFKTDFVKRVNNRDQIRFNLVNKCTEMLCVKESIFENYMEEINYKIFISNDKKQFLCVYYNFTKFDVDQFVEEISKLDGQKQVYIFSETKEPDLEPFYGVKNCEIQAIPEPIFEIYKELKLIKVCKKNNSI